MKDQDIDDVLKRMNRRRFIAGAGVTGAAVLAGCAGGGSTTTEAPGEATTAAGEETPTPEPSGGGTLNLAQVKSPIEFDPVVLNDVPSSQVASQLFEALYAYGESTDIVPELAAGDPEVSEDTTRYVVEMTGDATFHNGDPVTAEDVKYSFEAPVAEETENASEVNMIDSIAAVDETTVQFDPKYPFGAFMNALAGRSVVPMSVREGDKQAFNTSNPVGSGPFRFDGWQEGDYVDVVAYDDYWGEPKPSLAKIHFTPVEEATTRGRTTERSRSGSGPSSSRTASRRGSRVGS